MAIIEDPTHLGRFQVFQRETLGARSARLARNVDKERQRKRHAEEASRLRPISDDEDSRPGETPQEKQGRISRNYGKEKRQKAKAREDSEYRKAEEYKKERQLARNLNRDFDDVSSTRDDYNPKHYLAAIGLAVAKLPESTQKAQLECLAQCGLQIAGDSTRTTTATRTASVCLKEYSATSVDTPTDLRLALNKKRDLRRTLEERRREAREKELAHRHKWEKEHGPLYDSDHQEDERHNPRNRSLRRKSPTRRQSKTKDDRPYSPHSEYDGIRAFSSSVRSVQWPSTFKLANIDKYDPKENPEE